MGMVTVAGENNSHSVVVYTMSSCTPCWKTKKLFDSQSVKYEYLDLDTAAPWERSEAMVEIGEHLPGGGVKIFFPVIIIDGRTVIYGYDKGKLSEFLELHYQVLIRSFFTRARQLVT